MAKQKRLLFTLFRIQLFLPEQMPLFVELREPQEFLKAAFMERPSVSNSRSSWHIGNIKDVSPMGLYFAIGKELPRKLAGLDEGGDFHDYSALVAPNTHAFLDLHYQVLAIAKNSDLAPDSKAVAKKLEKLLQATEIIKSTGGRVDIAAIDDPDEFIKILATAAAVTKFQVSYGFPNVWDAEEDFQQPFQKASRSIGAEESTATFKAKDLNREKLMKLTRAAASVGKRAKAWVRRLPEAKPVPLTPKSNPATVSASPPPETSQQMASWVNDTLIEVRRLYEEIRSRSD